MATWDDLQAAVFVWTNRPKLIAETQQALRTAIRTAHRLGKFWRDLTIVPVTSLPLDAIQTIDLTMNCPRMRQLAYVKSGTTDKKYTEVTVLDLLDYEGYARVDVYWGVGTDLNIRSCSPEDSYSIAYYRHPVTSPPESIDDWLLTDYQDVVVLLAASTVLGAVGEQEIKKTVDALFGVAASDLISDQIEVTGR